MAVVGGEDAVRSCTVQYFCRADEGLRRIAATSAAKRVQRPVSTDYLRLRPLRGFAIGVRLGQHPYLRIPVLAFID